MDEIRAHQILQTEELQRVLDQTHKDVSERVNSVRARKILEHNAKTNVLPANFGEGDFVLVRRAQKNKGHELPFLWKAPRGIVRALSK